MSIKLVISTTVDFIRFFILITRISCVGIISVLALCKLHIQPYTCKTQVWINGCLPMKKMRSICPVSAGLEIFGDRWTLLIIRDLFAGKTTYSEFISSPEKISTNILSSRLNWLEEQGIINSQEKSERTGKAIYKLTEKGSSLYPVVDAIANWSLTYVDGTKKLITVPEK